MAEDRPKIGIITISDRASAGTYEDQSGPAIESVLLEYLATECDYLPSSPINRSARTTIAGPSTRVASPKPAHGDAGQICTRNR